MLDTDVTFHLTSDSDEDIIRAIQCIYAVYGYNYIHQQFYHIDIFKKQLQSEKYISLLAENKHHQALGHIAAEEHDWLSGIMELCNLVVKPCARGLNLAGRLEKEIIKIANQKHIVGLYGMPVMFHPISQKLLDKMVLRPAVCVLMRQAQRIEKNTRKTGIACML